MPPVVPESAGSESKASITLREVLDKNDVIQVLDNDVIIVAPKKFAETVSMRELGTASVSPFTSNLRSEYNWELQGLQGLLNYDKMRKNDGTVRGTLRQIKTPVLQARWFVEPASESTRDQNAAAFLTWCLEEALSMPFGQLIQECLLMLEFGYYMFEKVWGEGVWNNRNVMYWKKLAPRHPVDVIDWEYDKNGGPNGVLFTPPDNLYNVDPIPIPIKKLLVFSFDKEAGNIEGISVLRSAYKHWYYKEQLYKIDAIQKERHGIGVPIIQLPPNFSPEDKVLAQEMGRNVRTNESANIVLPPNWIFTFAELHGNPVDALASAQHHDLQIQKNIMAPFLDNPATSDQMATFNAACRFIADMIADTFNKYAIPQLIAYNFSRVGTPKLRVTNIGSKTDLRTLSFALRNFVGAGLITPDERLENYLRDMSDLPAADPKTARSIAAPQLVQAQPKQVTIDANGNPVQVPSTPSIPVPGLPRQSTAAGNQQGQNAGNNARVGNDQSGAA
jgi:hypothetical protein